MGYLFPPKTMMKICHGFRWNYLFEIGMITRPRAGMRGACQKHGGRQFSRKCAANRTNDYPGEAETRDASSEAGDTMAQLTRKRDATGQGHA